MKLLITGATGKVGQNFLTEFLSRTAYKNAEVVALCNNRTIAESDRVRVIRGSLADADSVTQAMDGVTHVVHMAAVKESPDLVIDVAIKGMFLMLETFRQSPTAEQFLLIGGDCSVGHIFHDYPSPITEESPRKAYPGCYALTKVLEEVMLEQYHFQYGLNGTILRAPWIMEKDDFRYAMSFGEDQFGGPNWDDLMSKADRKTYAAGKYIPLMKDVNGDPLRRNFIHVDDLVGAILKALGNPVSYGETYNICMNEPVNYAQMAAYAKQLYGYEIVEISTPYFSNWLDNTKARLRLGWAPAVELEALIERAWQYKRDVKDPRKVWYPG